MKYDTATPYGSAYVIFRKGNKVAFVLRANTDWMNNYYGLPAGKLEKGETFTQAAIREAKEEVGIDLEPRNLKQVLMAHRNGSDDNTTWVDVLFEAIRWDGELVNAEPHVHSEVAWLDIQHLPKNIVPAVRFYLEQIQAGKHYTEHGWGD